ncbi:hypothetical protein acsn021_01780 [Anaerocolumna cellulosilytica]|uniref:Uncharacterized protein n=1 Tax=Anaerocolumna cellulosilytica TaxID=433286 RepID=A0A6S6QU44_9FIRM|nr:hypothetical protein [Anaerocolumna cellulosilytica]MBB5197918.1 uncharacterized protein YjaZ [Anaerocolumna cellulosilytica]BCJ92609.1 hypothetical protein acsn021_01780 [Anaerocolumna cellulosilytica]
MLKRDTSMEYLSYSMAEQFEKSMSLFLNDYNKNRTEIDYNFVKAMDKLCEKCIQMQEKEEKGEIAVISIFYLKSSILMDKYQLQINLYNENFYLDRADLFGLWDITFLMKYFAEDIKSIYQKAVHHIARFSYADYQELKMQYAEAYHFILQKFCQERAAEVINLASYQAMKKWEQTIITYGGFMDKGVCIFPVEPMEGAGV